MNTSGTEPSSVNLSKKKNEFQKLESDAPKLQQNYNFTQL